MAIERNLLRDQVKQEVLDLVMSGELNDSERIAEAALAERLGVSRTPVREALGRLEEEGVMCSVPGKGFSVMPLSAEQARDLYPVISALEGMAIRSAEELPDLDQARSLNEQMLAHQTDDEVCRRLDAEFHAALVAKTTNQRLRNLLADQQQVLARYEAAYMRYTAQHPDSRRTMATSVAEHDLILDALAAGDRNAAVRALEANWQNGMERLLEIFGDLVEANGPR
jgi:DNA-binding GntR family transcriptional regulator